MQPVFTETQHFNKWWHYLLAGLPMIIVTVISIGILLKNFDSQTKQDALVDMGIASFVTILIFVWFVIITLKTRIDHNGISVNCSGIPFCKRTIAWSEIRNISVITYSPLGDYGGWGVRYGMAGNGWGYIVAGDQGIKLFYQNGKPFLIGTQKSEEAKQIIEHYFKQTHI